MNKKVIIIGGKGNGTVIAQAIQHYNSLGNNDLEIKGFFSDRIKPGELIDGLPVLAETSKENVHKFFQEGFNFIYTVLRIDGNEERLELYNKLEISDEMLISFIHPLAYVAPNVVIEKGVVIMPYVMISSSAIIKKNTLIMTGATIGHDTIVGEFNHIASQAVVGAYIKTGKGVHIGLNATVREHLVLGDFSTVGMGSVLTKNIGNNEIWAGNPAKFLRKAE